MPSVSKKQHNFMAAVANNPKFAKKTGVSSAVGKEFLTADKGKTFKQGGAMKKVRKFAEGGFEDVDTAALRRAAMYGGLGKAIPRLPSEGIQEIYENPITKKMKDAVAKTYGLSPSGVARSVAKMGANAGRKASKGTDNELSDMSDVVGAKKGGFMKHGDIAKDKPMMKKVAAKAVKGHEKKMHGMKSGGMAYSKGGQLSKADGCATKGKSKGTMVKMKNGGTC